MLRVELWFWTYYSIIISYLEKNTELDNYSIQAFHKYIYI